MKISIRFAAVVAWFFLVAGLAQAADPLATGPTTLTIQYHTAPGDRLAVKDYMHVTGFKQLEGWKKQGMLKDYKVFWSRYVDHMNWDMLWVLQFPDTKQVAEWKKVEARFPGG